MVSYGELWWVQAPVILSYYMLELIINHYPHINVSPDRTYIIVGRQRSRNKLTSFNCYLEQEQNGWHLDQTKVSYPPRKQKKTFCGFSMGRNQYWAGRVYDLCVYYMTGTPEGSTKSGLWRNRESNLRPHSAYPLHHGGFSTMIYCGSYVWGHLMGKCFFTGLSNCIYWGMDGGSRISVFNNFTTQSDIDWAFFIPNSKFQKILAWPYISKINKAIWTHICLLFVKNRKKQQQNILIKFNGKWKFEMDASNW